MRQALAVLSAAVVASVGAIVLGEYDLTGFVALIAGVIFGLAVTEVAVSVARRLTPPIAAMTAVISGLGFTWAVWIATNHFRDPIPVSAWIGVVLSVAGSVAWSMGSVRMTGTGSKDGAGRPVA